MHEESSQLGLEINWSKTKIQASESIQGSSVPVLDHQVNLVDTFVYLGSSTDQDGGCDTDVRRRTELAHSYMRALDRGIWRTSISLPTKLNLYNIYIPQFCFMVLTRGQWLSQPGDVSMLLTSGACDTFFACHTQPMSQFWQSVSEHYRASYARALQAFMPPSTVYQSIGDVRAVVTRQSWLRTIERDLKTQNIGLSSAWHIAHRRSRWHRVVETAELRRAEDDEMNMCLKSIDRRRPLYCWFRCLLTHLLYIRTVLRIAVTIFLNWEQLGAPSLSLSFT